METCEGSCALLNGLRKTESLGWKKKYKVASNYTDIAYQRNDNAFQKPWTPAEIFSENKKIGGGKFQIDGTRTTNESTENNSSTVSIFPQYFGTPKQEVNICTCIHRRQSWGSWMGDRDLPRFRAGRVVGVAGWVAGRGVHPPETMMHFPLFQISPLFSKNFKILWKF